VVGCLGLAATSGEQSFRREQSVGVEADVNCGQRSAGSLEPTTSDHLVSSSQGLMDGLTPPGESNGLMASTEATNREAV